MKQSTQKPPDYKMARMVRWFVPSVLFRAGIEAVVSSLFGNYADRREVQAALDISVRDDNDIYANDVVFDYSKEEDDLWIDFVADTGDGFNSTYSIASLVAKKELECGGEKLPRASLLIFGGDQIYPAPTSELYDQKLRTPYKAALPYNEKDEHRPHLFAIPGNHDWYDGLGNFLKVFCQQRFIGNWETKQRRSYFALQLPHRHWLWAIDIQLNEDIDEPQQHYFIRVTKAMSQDDKVILVTAKPAWVYKEWVKKDKSYQRLKFFIEHYITDDKAACIGKTFRLMTVLTGDLHHYSHYCSYNNNAKPDMHFVCAGGGAAALQLTHNLPETLKQVEEEHRKADPYRKDYQGKLPLQNTKCEKVYPSVGKSKQLVTGNLLFFWHNAKIGALFAAIYCLVYWLIQSRTLVAGKSYTEAIANASFGEWFDATISAFGYTPLAVMLCAILAIGLCSFGDNSRNGSILPKVVGLFHGLIHCLLIFLLPWFFSSIHDYDPSRHGWGYLVLFGAEVFFAGYLLSGLLIGTYFYLSNLILGNHIGDSSASLVIEDYKNFLRMRINKNGLTIYPIGIDTVTKNWKIDDSAQELSFVGDEVKYDLIEEPIEIS